jgi:two-component system KDP operon response regulator KdpE
VAGEHILAIDDEPRYLRVISFNLEQEGFRVTSATSGEQGLALFERIDPDLVILDVMLPGLDGFEVCRRIRELSSRPIIMLTAKGAEEDKIKGLRLGADDYVTKPFSAGELLARVDAVFRRTRPTETRQPTLALGDLLIDHLGKRVTIRGTEVRLSPTEYRLLTCLAGNAGVVLSRDELLEEVWGVQYRGEDEILRVALWRLRQKLEDDPASPRYILTRPGMGYLFAAPETL